MMKEDLEEDFEEGFEMKNNKWHDLQEEEREARIENAQKILGNDINSKIMLARNKSEKFRKSESFIDGLQLNEYQKLLNPEGQDKMMTLDEFINHNPNIPDKIIYKKLVNLKYAHKYNFIHNWERVHWYAQQKPYTYLSIIPLYCPENNNFLLYNDLALSDEAVKTLQIESEKEYKKQIEERKRKEQEMEEHRKKYYLF